MLLTHKAFARARRLSPYPLASGARHGIKKDSKTPWGSTEPGGVRPPVLSPVLPTVLILVLTSVFFKNMVFQQQHAEIRLGCVIYYTSFSCPAA